MRLLSSFDRCVGESLADHGRAGIHSDNPSGFGVAKPHDARPGQLPFDLLIEDDRDD